MMQLVVKVVNFIVSRALNHRQIRSLLDEYDTEYDDLVMTARLDGCRVAECLRDF